MVVLKVSFFIILKFAKNINSVNAMKNKIKNIEVITLGCAKNIVDSERLMEQLKLNNVNLVGNAEDAEAVIINTCGFIEDAKQESINTILNAIEAKKNNKIKKVIVAGCLSERYKSDLEKELPQVDAFLGTEDYRGILDQFDYSLKENLLGERVVTTPNHYAYIKISEGCDNPCSFCAIPLMRGKHKSKPIEFLINEATALAKKGVKELIIIAQDTTDYGKDIYGKRSIAKLLRELSKVTGIEWIRLLYAYPSHFPDDLIEEIKTNPKICKYIDMPLQHISDNVLKSMRRGITKNTTIKLIRKLKENIPGLTLRTTFITGYPTEGEKEFNELYNFIEDIQFDRVGIFKYSREENTPGFILGDPVDDTIKEERLATLMELQSSISAKKNKSFVRKVLKVVIDDLRDNYYIARSERDTPEVDGEILIENNGKSLEIGKFYSVEIIDANEYDLFGNIII